MAGMCLLVLPVHRTQSIANRIPVWLKQWTILLCRLLIDKLEFRFRFSLWKEWQLCLNSISTLLYIGVSYTPELCPLSYCFLYWPIYMKNQSKYWVAFDHWETPISRSRESKEWKKSNFPFVRFVDLLSLEWCRQPDSVCGHIGYLLPPIQPEIIPNLGHILKGILF